MTLDPSSAQLTAARVAAAADLVDVRLLEAHVTLERLVADVHLAYELKMTQKVEFTTGEDFFAVRIKYDLPIDIAENEGDGDHVCDINFELGALYSLADAKLEPSDEELTAYAETSATLTLYPYAREYVSDVTQRLGLPKLLLPTHRLPSPWHPDDEGEAGSESRA